MPASRRLLASVAALTTACALAGCAAENTDEQPNAAESPASSEQSPESSDQSSEGAESPEGAESSESSEDAEESPSASDGSSSESASSDSSSSDSDAGSASGLPGEGLQLTHPGPSAEGYEYAGNDPQFGLHQFESTENSCSIAVELYQDPGAADAEDDKAATTAFRDEILTSHEKNAEKNDAEIELKESEATFTGEALAPQEFDALRYDATVDFADGSTARSAALMRVFQEPSPTRWSYIYTCKKAEDFDEEEFSKAQRQFSVVGLQEDQESF